MNFQTSFLALVLVLLPAVQTVRAVVMYGCQSLILIHHLQTDGWMATAPPLQIHHISASHQMKRWSYSAEKKQYFQRQRVVVLRILK